MCGRYVLVSSIKTIESRFNVTADFERFEPNFNIGPGAFAPVILNRSRHTLSLAQFGLSPSWSKKRMYLFNARAEGDYNKTNDPDYTGGKGILNKPAFRQSIRSRRCLVIADAFIEGPEKEKLNKPFLVFLRNKQRPFAFAGIYEDFVDQSTGETWVTYSIVTTTANALLQTIKHPRSPVILSRRFERTWLNQKAPLTDITHLLEPYDPEEMNAYPIGAEIKDPRLNHPELITPCGDRLFKETTMEAKKETKLFGMGHSPARERRNSGST